MAPESQLTVGVLGLGQIGGSLCAALSGHRSRYRVAAFDPKSKLREAAIACSIVDRVYPDEQELIESSDVVVLATHIDVAVDLLKRNANLLQGKRLIFDVASIKSEICETATQLGLRNFIGGHPIAGTERVPPEAWDSGLFESTRFIYCPSDSVLSESAALILEVIGAVNARAEKITPAQNDYQFGLTIGLPHVFAYALKRLRTVQEEAGTSFDALIGPSYRSATRVAESDPAMVEQMLWHNREHLTEHLALLEKKLRVLREALARGDRAALNRFVRGQE